jgi:hypothetical protein
MRVEILYKDKFGQMNIVITVLGQLKAKWTEDELCFLSTHVASTKPTSRESSTSFFVDFLHGPMLFGAHISGVQCFQFYFVFVKFLDFFYDSPLY